MTRRNQDFEREGKDLFTSAMLWILAAMFAVCACLTVVAFSFVE